MTLAGQTQQEEDTVTLRVEPGKAILMEQIQEEVDKVILLVHQHSEVDTAMRTVQILEEVDKVIPLGLPQKHQLLVDTVTLEGHHTVLLEDKVRLGMLQSAVAVVVHVHRNNWPEVDNSPVPPPGDKVTHLEQLVEPHLEPLENTFL